MESTERKKSKVNPVSETPMRCSSSTDSDEFTPYANDPNRVSLQVITNVGQSKKVETQFKSLISRLDATLNLITVSESSDVIKSPKEQKQNKNQQRLPSIAIVLFFNEATNPIHGQSDNKDNTNLQNNIENEFSLLTDNENNSKDGNGVNEIRKIFNSAPWRFHHKVAITGKLTTCDSNTQDYFEYNPDLKSIKTSKIVLNNEQFPSFPLWGIRKVHYGRRILRFTCFVTSLNWEDQINFYKLILREKETKVRDDFCFFDVYSNQTTIVQLGLKKLPSGLKPDILKSSILQFKVKNVGHLVPLLPHSCEPISTLRWRTRDHDNNVVLLQIQCSSRDAASEKNFAENVFAGCGTPEGYSPSRGPSPFTQRATQSTPVTPTLRSKTPQRNKPNGGTEGGGSLQDSFVCPALPEKMPLLKPTLGYLPKSSTNTSLSNSTSPERNAENCVKKGFRDYRGNKTTIDTKKRSKTPQISESPILKVQNRKTEAFYV